MASKEEFKAILDAPIYLAPNTFLHFYGGGKLRAEFMGELDPKDDYRSEEWMFSTNRALTPGRDNPPDKGFIRVQLANGEMVLLKHLLDVFPEQMLGRRHVDKFGSNLGVLVKIFDVGDGSHIPLHWHPALSLRISISTLRSVKLRRGLSLGQGGEQKHGLVARRSSR